MTAEQATRYQCTVEGCTNLPEDHTTKNGFDDLIHWREPMDLPIDTDIEWPMRISIPLHSGTNGLWEMLVEVRDIPKALTPDQVHFMAMELELNAAYVAEVNRKIRQDV
jgi:hypothetical protein